MAEDDGQSEAVDLLFRKAASMLNQAYLVLSEKAKAQIHQDELTAIQTEFLEECFHSKKLSSNIC